MTHLRRAAARDVAAIAAIQRAVRLGAREKAEAARAGFLATDFSETDYARLVAWADHVYVAEGAGGIDAFVLAYTSERIDDEDPVSAATLERLSGPFVYIKQVGVRPEAQRRGLARRLYDHLRAAAGNQPCAAAIVLDPPNEASSAFHRSMGFRRAFDVDSPDGRGRALWCDDPADRLA